MIILTIMIMNALAHIHDTLRAMISTVIKRFMVYMWRQEADCSTSVGDCSVIGQLLSTMILFFR